jgi:hypothetical protein
MTFAERMVGWYFPGMGTPSDDRAGNLTIGLRIPASGDPPGGVAGDFSARKWEFPM